jgi:hypothetical protein
MSIFNNDTKPLDVSTLTVDLEDRLRPFEERLQRIERQYLEWCQREQARPGSVISTAAPGEVQEAIQRAERERAETALKFFRSVEPAIRAELGRRVDEIRPLYETLARQMDHLVNLERDIAALTRRCGRFPSASVADPGVSETNYLAWRARIEPILRPPKPAPRVTAETNPLPSF